MIKCKNGNCIYEYCCAECDGQKSQKGICDCCIAVELNHDKELILQKCEYAELIN